MDFTHVYQHNTNNILISLLNDLADKYNNKNICDHEITKQQKLSNYLKYVIDKKIYNDFDSILHNLIFSDQDDFVVISTKKINNNLSHLDKKIDKILHEMKFMIIDKSCYYPICYVEKAITETEYINERPENNTYLKNNVYDVVKNFHTDNFDQNKIIVTRHHNGNYIVLFHSSNKWFFTHSYSSPSCSNITINELTKETHPVLFEHIGHKINQFNTDYTYHIVLSDTRIKRLITPTNEKNYVVLIKLMPKLTNSNIEPINTIMNQDDNKNILCQVNECMFLDERVYVSCYDELIFILDELDDTNIYKKRLMYIGYIVRINDINIILNVSSYKKLLTTIPKYMSINEIHLNLYQNDKLNHLLHYVSDSYNDIVRRINLSISTISKEILDIYHLTRNMKNCELYGVLTNSYKQILYQLHSEYIINKTDDILNHDDFDEKISITVDNVYNKLKKIDTNLLIELYRDRENITNDIMSINPNIIKPCIYTIVQTKLLFN